MARIRDPVRDKAKELWLEAGGENAPKGILKEIAEKLNVSEGTIRGWKAKDKWSDFNKNETERSVKNMERSNENNKKKLQLEESDFEYVDDDGLTDKQRLFCNYYMQSFNATQAAIKAGYSEKSAYQIGYQLLQKTSVKAYLKNLKEQQKSELFISQEWVLNRHAQIANSNINDYITPDGTLKKNTDGTLIKKITVKTSRSEFEGSYKESSTVSIELEDRKESLKFLTKYLGLEKEESSNKGDEDDGTLKIEVIK
ncbi:terminase small subunit [Fusobacterium sp.]|uniref:terminase small subunit n=1 Tax=Fusobacterium sp. TaxID=68766 RepID=UPI0026052405|nr:terminase small subunit [Fusobacterium sp.]